MCLVVNDHDLIIGNVIIRCRYMFYIAALRQPYREDDDVLLESTLPTKDPVKLFETWFNEIKNNDKSVEANAVCVSTCTK